MYELVMQSPEGEAALLGYNPITNILSEGGRPLAPEVRGREKKKRIIRFALGKKCNFSCVYCCQNQSGKKDVQPADLARLADQVLRLAPAQEIGSVQFWGGEPLLYFEEIRALHAIFQERGVSAFHTTSNGSLLKGERFDWIRDNNISLSISHDGPGQRLRGRDPFADREILSNVLCLMDGNAGKITISAVLTKASYRHREIIDYFSRVLGRDDFILTEGAPIVAADEASRSAAVPEENLPEYTRTLYMALLKNEIPQYRMPHEAALDFLCSLGAPSGKTCNCVCNSPDTLVVDLAGNILTCCTFTAQDRDESGEGHCTGNIWGQESFPASAAPLSRLKKRQKEKCRQCLVWELCRGGCPFVPEKYAEYHCKAQYHMRLPAFGLALYMLSEGNVLSEVRPMAAEQTT
jgi:uncharacterized protein